jgi:long-chain acyl-CoA synthetase
VNPRTPVDEFTPRWANFAAFFLGRADVDSDFLTELDHDRGARAAWTVGAWQARVFQIGRWLEQQGVGHGDAVATLAGNTADALALAYGCWVLGACVVPLNPGDSDSRHRHILQDAGARLLIHADAAGLDSVDTGSGLRLIATSRLPQRDADPAAAAQWRPVLRGQGLDVPALRVYTSGTTGDPKGVVLTAANLLTDCDALALSLAWPAGSRILTVLPVHHVNGLVVSSLLPWYARHSTVLCDRFRSESFWTDVAQEQATVSSVVPSLLEFLLRTPGSAPEHFQEFLCGAGPLLVETAVEVEQRFAVPVRHLYGLSETTAVVTLMPSLDSEERLTWHRDYGFPSIGPALPHVEVDVLDPYAHRADAGARGELVARGGVVMRGYASNPDATEEVFRDGWFHSGDEGFWQPGREGHRYFFITGRMKELIIRGGANISPFEIDAVLRTHPAVRHGLAVPFDNRFYGEEVAAYVVRDADVSEEEILAHCASRLDFARCPKVMLFGDDVPYTATGKAKRMELRQRLAPQLHRYRDVQFRRSAQTSQ